ncbi:hypothetical protein BBJ28_00010897 [Nothophytophthora sp. Chile5]|nr:hypothetical protein BBJ28_00010897 [Nothophytophthora sp. Chile5]
MNAQSRRSGPPSSMTARKSAAVSAGGVNARRIAAARAAARQAKEQEAAEEERGNRCGNPFCRKQLTNRYARFCEDSAMCQWHRALKLQCQANAEAAAKAEEDDEDDRPLARLKPGKQKLKKKPSKTKTLILSGENERAVKLKESEVADKPFAIPRRKRSEAAADAASAAATTARTSVLEADSEATSAPNSPKQKLKKKKRQQKQAEVEETEAETKRRRKKLRRARDAAAASAQSSAASSPERTAADASLNDLSSAQASSASSAEDVTSLAERLKKRSLGQHPRDPRARRPPRDVAIREIGSDAEMGKTAAAAAAMPSTKKRRLSRRVSADDVLAHPASSPLTAASGVAPAAAQLPPDTSWKIPGSRAARAVTAAATATQTIKRMGIELVPLGVANQAAGFAGGGRWVSTRDRSRPDRDILEIEQATFSYHESFLVHMLSTFIQKLPHALEAVFNATKKPRKMNWYIKYTERIERICEPYVRVKVENTKAVVTVRDREWLALEGSSTVTLYTDVIKSLLAEAVSWRGLKDEAEKALEQFRGRFDNVNMSFVFLRAWNALKHQREYMSLPRQANYFRGDRLHHWNFVVGKVEIGSGSHEENREAFRLATVKALDFLLNLSSDRYGSRSASWRPSPEHKP